MEDLAISNITADSCNSSPFVSFICFFLFTMSRMRRCRNLFSLVRKNPEIILLFFFLLPLLLLLLPLPVCPFPPSSGITGGILVSLFFFCFVLLLESSLVASFLGILARGSNSQLVLGRTRCGPFWKTSLGDSRFELFLSYYWRCCCFGRGVSSAFLFLFLFKKDFFVVVVSRSFQGGYSWKTKQNKKN